MIYEDRLVKAELPENAAADGHVVITMQRATKRLGDLSAAESAHFFTVASYTAAILFQGLQAEGTNIIVHEDPLAAHVIARRKDDELDFTWEPGKQDAAALQDAEERIKEQTFMIGKSAAEVSGEKTVKEERSEEETEKEGGVAKSDLDDAEEEENYLIKQLLRVP